MLNPADIVAHLSGKVKTREQSPVDRNGATATDDALRIAIDLPIFGTDNPAAATAKSFLVFSNNSQQSQNQTLTLAIG